MKLLYELFDDFEELKSKKSILLSDKEALLSLSSKISEQKKILSIYRNHADVLDKVPCGSTYTHNCDFIKEARSEEHTSELQSH